jgi:hypothetical protein
MPTADPGYAISLTQQHPPHLILFLSDICFDIGVLVSTFHKDFACYMHIGQSESLSLTDCTMVQQTSHHAF